MVTAAAGTSRRCTHAERRRRLASGFVTASQMPISPQTPLWGASGHHRGAAPCGQPFGPCGLPAGQADGRRSRPRACPQVGPHSGHTPRGSARCQTWAACGAIITVFACADRASDLSLFWPAFREPEGAREGVLPARLPPRHQVVDLVPVGAVPEPIRAVGRSVGRYPGRSHHTAAARQFRAV